MEKYTTDFVYEKEDGDLAVRECVFRNHLGKPLTVKLLDALRSFWNGRRITDYDKIDELKRAANFLMTERLSSCSYMSKSGMKIAINKIGEDKKVQRVG